MAMMEKNSFFIVQIIRLFFKFHIFSYKLYCGICHRGSKHCFYQKLAAYGHLGREELGVGWEKTDIASALKEKAIG